MKRLFTMKQLAEMSGCSVSTLYRATTIVHKATNKQLRQLSKGEISQNQVYKSIKKEEEK